MSTVVKRVLIGIAVLLLTVILVVGGYVLYVVANYQRLGDIALDVDGSDPAQSIQVGQEYHALTWNVGFGAYDQEYSFFMDESVLTRDVAGVGNAGDTITGISSTSKDQETAERLTEGVIQALEELSASISAGASTNIAIQERDTTNDADTPTVQTSGIDLLLLQEVDTDAHRSFRVNQVDLINTARAEENPQSVFASNFHTVWLHYPVLNPIGDIQSGLLTSSAFTIDSAQRYGYTIDESFPTKFFDLDRCFSASYIPVENSNKQLVVINSHMTAYSSSNNIREQQLRELMDFAQAEYDKGNYVIIGGDFNQVLSSDPERGITNWQNAEEIPTWVGTLNTNLLGTDFSAVYASNEFEVSTCRDSSFPYLPGENYEVVIDGFVVSRNVTASSVNLQENYTYSDHNPVLLSFTLQ